MPDAYIGREQAYIKHTILRTYLQRMFLIVGRSKELVINYVDCFAGPWKEEDDRLGDTSIGISLERMDSCQKYLEEKFSRKVKFRALYIEKSPESFEKLQAFLKNNPYPDIEVRCLKGNYTDIIDEIIDWCGSYFTFFFVDPTGWQKVVGAITMQNLLKLEKAEFLINLMYDFINRFIALEKHSEDMIEIFGEVPVFSDETPEQRQNNLLALYRKNMNNYFEGRTAFVPINKPGNKRILYYLVYFTRHSRGIEVFKTEAQKMNIVQRITQQEYKLRKQLGQAETMDMFGSDLDIFPDNHEYSDNKYAAKKYLMEKLSTEPMLIDIDRWASFLEDSDFYPIDYQMAIKELVDEGRVKNIDADVSRRTKHLINPDKRERWILV